MSLSNYHRGLLHLAVKLVPADDRHEWLLGWEADLWHVRHRRQGSSLRSLRLNADLTLGVVRDAFWLRGEQWRRMFQGTSLLCLAFIFATGVLASSLGAVLAGSWHDFGLYLSGHLGYCLAAGPLALFAAVGTAPSGAMERDSSTSALYWISRQIFLSTKISLTLLLAFLLSADLCLPARAQFRMTSDLLQVLFFVVFTLLGLRWCFLDQEQRCKQCLRSLSLPSRVGRPSHNLLEWNGTELHCEHGHGRLSVPEMETSWCGYSRWVGPGAGPGTAA